MHRAPVGGKFSVLAPLALAAIVALGRAPGAVAAPQEEAGRRALGIGNFKPPPRWELRPLDQPTYPQLLAWASRGQGPDQAVMTLVVRRLMPGTSVQRFAGESAAVKNVPGLGAVRLQTQTIEGFGGRRVQLDGVLEGTPRRVVRQIYLVNTPGDAGYVLTLVAPQAQAVARLRDLEDTAASLAEVTPSAPPPAPPASTPPPPPSAPPVEGPASPSASPR